MRNQSQLHFNYFEAIIQIRPLDKEVYEYVRKQIAKTDAFISKEIVLKTGVDIYISSHKLAKQIGRRLMRSFKGELKVSHLHYGMDKETSKNIYRATVFFRKL